jgi:hypothetical protein
MMPKNSSRARKSRQSRKTTGVASGRVANTLRRPTELERLDVFIGRWLTEGETVGGREGPAMQIVASDVYEWAPGRRFVMHPAYGRIGEVGIGGLEVIGYDPATGQYRTYFFDSQGNIITETLSYRDGTWTWQGEHARCTGVFSKDGKTLTARHERSDDGKHWEPSMTVTLHKIE